MKQSAIISFDTFANFKRLKNASPLFYRSPPEWAAAAHAILIGETIHYLWARRNPENSWVLMHSYAPEISPAKVVHNPMNPVFTPSKEGFDDYTTEYPCPFVNPHNGKLYAYYLGKRRSLPKQTGLAIGESDFSTWKRVNKIPVIAAEADYEKDGSSHPAVAISKDTIHITYTGESEGPPVLCHATAPVGDPSMVSKDVANPVFTGSGREWDSAGVREAEILLGPSYYHIFYGGFDGKVWRAGHVRTRDFRSFEPNPHNPILSPSTDPDSWDRDGILTPQVFAANGRFYMLYAGLKGQEWQSGLAVAGG